VAIPTVPSNSKVTKRIIASQLGKVYDILGFYSPVTIKAKILLKKLWQAQTGWDTSVPADIAKAWNHWTSQLTTLSTHNVTRCYTSKPNIANRSLHGFSDASQEAYEGVLYLRTEYEDYTASTAMVISKSRVVPLKRMTIRRAELTATYTLAKQLHHCSHLLQVENIHAWSDSSIVLCWLRKSPNALKTFVSNRVQRIQDLFPTAQWRHVPTNHNPADMLSSGVSTDELTKSKLWWEGPPWIQLPQQEWPSPSFQVPNQIPEVKVAILTAPMVTEDKPWDHVYNFNNTMRIFFWCRQFSNNCKLPSDKQNLTPRLQTEEVISYYTYTYTSQKPSRV